MHTTPRIHLSRRGLVAGAGLTAGVSAGVTALSAPAYSGTVRQRRTRLPGQGEVVYVVPSGLRRGQRLPLVVYHHGAGSLARDDLALPGMGRLLRRIATNGYCVAVSDFGGSLWGNDQDHRYIAEVIDAARRHLAANGPVTLLGSSMGAGAVLSFAGRYPGRVRSVVALQPALDLLDLSRKGFRVDQRYPGGYSNRRYGKQHSPLIQAGVRHGGREGRRSFDGVPIRIYYGTEDHISDPAIVREFARRVGRGRDPQVGLRPIRGADHGDTLVGRVPIQDLVGFVEDHHPPGRI